MPAHCRFAPQHILPPVTRNARARGRVTFNDKSTGISGRHMTNSRPERRMAQRHIAHRRTAQTGAEEDVHPADIVMALGGCWVLLAVIAWLAMA
jgi:hypothetical protein